jgi:hypothetical protein
MCPLSHTVVSGLYGSPYQPLANRLIHFCNHVYFVNQFQTVQQQDDLAKRGCHEVLGGSRNGQDAMFEERAAAAHAFFLPAHASQAQLQAAAPVLLASSDRCLA